MSPLRLVVLGILFYLLFRLVMGLMRKKVVPRQCNKEEPPAVADVLVEDPVCHTLVPKGQAVRLQHGQSLYYFCSEACCRRFISEKGEQK